MEKIHIPYDPQPTRNESILQHIARSIDEMKDKKEAMEVIFKICKELEKEKWWGRDFWFLRQQKEKAYKFIQEGKK